MKALSCSLLTLALLCLTAAYACADDVRNPKSGGFLVPQGPEQAPAWGLERQPSGLLAWTADRREPGRSTPRQTSGRGVRSNRGPNQPGGPGFSQPGYQYHHNRQAPWHGGYHDGHGYYRGGYGDYLRGRGYQSDDRGYYHDGRGQYQDRPGGLPPAPGNPNPGRRSYP